MRGPQEHQTAPQTWQERFEALSYLASDAWDPLTDPNEYGDAIDINTGQGYQQMMSYGGCAVLPQPTLRGLHKVIIRLG